MYLNKKKKMELTTDQKKFLEQWMDFLKIPSVSADPANKKDVAKFYDVADDVKSGEHGTQLIDAIYGSSVGFKGDALVELENLSKSRKDDAESKLEFKTANFENRIYSVVKC